MAALADHDALDAELQRRLADAQRDLAQLFVVADEHAEVAGLAGLGRERPADAGGMEDLAVADQALDMRLGEEVGAGRDQQHLGALHVQRVAHGHAGVLERVLFQALQRVFQRRPGQAQVVADLVAQVVADLVDLADDLVAVLLAQAHAGHDLARGHGDFGGVDAVGAEHAAAAAFAALVVVAPPLVEHVLRHVHRPHQLGEVLSSEGEVAAIDRAHQVLARHRHVLRVARAQEVVALVAAGAAVHAGVHVHAQAAVLAQQFAHAGNRTLFPALGQLARKAHVVESPRWSGSPPTRRRA